MSKEISIRVAKSSDYDAVVDCFRQHYYKEEPLTLAHPEPGHTKDDEDFTMSHILSDTVLIAIEKESGKIVGALSAGPIEPGDADQMIEDSKTTESKKWSEIMLFLAFLEKKSDVLNRFNVNTCLHIHAVGVSSEFRGNKIGEKLFSACFDNAKRLKYKLVSADCTSIFSIKIAERLGMECVSIVTYDEYNKSIGEELFHPTAPNLEIKSFVKRIDEIDFTDNSPQSTPICN